MFGITSETLVIFIYSAVIVSMHQYPAVCSRGTKGDAKYKCAMRNVVSGLITDKIMACVAATN